MKQHIGVSFSPVGTVLSTLTSFFSLAKQIPETSGSVSNVALDGRWLKIEFDEHEGTSDYAVWRDGMKVNISFKKLNVDALNQAITEFTNILFSLQIKFGGVYDVQNLSVNDMILSLHLTESIFQTVDSQENTKEQVNDSKFIEEQDQDNFIASANRLLLIDASNLINACYYATAYGKDEKDLMKSSTGVYTNAIKALIDRFISIVRIYTPTHCAVAIDSKRSELYRREIYPEYKANRDGKEKPQPLEQQFPLAYELFEAMNIPQLKVESMEADDTIAALTKRWIEEKRGDVIILSNDKDLHQLLDGDVTQVLSGNAEVTRESFIEKYGITPEQFADYKSLCGEDSDNIPGVPGIGDKTAVKLLKEYQTLEGILANIGQLKGKLKERMEQHTEEAKMSKLLAILYTDLRELDKVSMDDLKMKINKEGMRSVLEKLEINLARAVA